MKNNTNIKIPKKYEHMIEEVTKDSDGYWVYTAPGFHSPEMGCHTIHEDTHADIMRVVRGIKPCECNDCKAS